MPAQIEVNFLAKPTFDRMPMQQPTINIRIISSGSIEGRPI